MSSSGIVRRLAIVMFMAISAMMLAAISTVHTQSPSGEALYVQASVDNETPYLGQQIIYSFRLYQRAGVNLDSRSVRYEPPGFTGFWNSGETAQDSYAENIGPDEYRVVELRTALFPSVVGPAPIGPASLEISIASAGAPHALKSSDVTIGVRPLPPNPPEGFTGAVGRVEISASVDAAEGKVNEPLQLTVNISGEGNIEALPDPDWPEFAGWRVIESPVSSDSRVVAGRVTGSRIYTITLVPERAGDLTIPEIPYPHFDPDLEQYVQAVTNPISVSISEADGSPAVAQLPAVEAADEESQEMRPLKAVPASLRRTGTELADSNVYWAAWAIPALVIVGAGAWRHRRTSLEAARAEALRRSALPDARAALSRAVSSDGDPTVAAAEAVLSYLSARLETLVSGLTREALLSQLREAGVEPELLDRVSEFLSAGESARYTPPDAGSAGAGGHSELASQLLGDLEEAISA